MPLIQPSQDQENSTSDKYKECLSHGATSKDSGSNPLNLFDDSNREDCMWLKIARDCLDKL